MKFDDLERLRLKHPTPWRVENQGEGDRAILDKNGDYVTIIHAGWVRLPKQPGGYIRGRKDWQTAQRVATLIVEAVNDYLADGA